MSLDTPDAFYTEAQRAMQRAEGREKLADTVFAAIVSDELDDKHRAFIESRDFFFLASVDASGMPTTSYKGGPVGVVRVDGPKALSFPAYDGNGMYKSLGNVAETGKVGLLFIDFETPNRVRVQGDARISRDADMLGRWPGAKMALALRARCRRRSAPPVLETHRHGSARPLRRRTGANRSRGRHDRLRRLCRPTEPRGVLTREATCRTSLTSTGPLCRSRRTTGQPPIYRAPPWLRSGSRLQTAQWWISPCSLG